LTIELTDEQFFSFVKNNRDLRFERTASGELIVMPPTGSDTGRRNIKITFQLEAWSRQNDRGIASTLPPASNCLMVDRSPDASWVKRDR